MFQIRILIAISLFGAIALSNGRMFTRELRLSSEQLKSALSEWRSLVSAKIPSGSVLREIINDDLYAMKWLESGAMDIDEAKESFLKHLEWREKENIDDLENQDWSLFQDEYQLFMRNMNDKTGKPVAEMWLSDWDIRRALVSGMRRKLTQWIARMVERLQTRLYQARKQGNDATHALLLIDLDGFNSVTLGCPQCIQLYAYWGLEFEANYPDLFDNVIIVNATPTFNSVLSALRAILRSKTMDKFQSYSKQKKVWLARLDAIVDRNERTGRFGGNINEELDNEI